MPTVTEPSSVPSFPTTARVPPRWAQFRVVLNWTDELKQLVPGP